MTLLSTESAERRAAPGTAVDPSGQAVLIVDDRADNLLALEEILRPLGADLFCVTTGEDALRALLKRQFAVIVLDVRLPGMDGFATARRIRQRIRTRYIPIIFLTGHASTGAQEAEGYAAGGVDYVVKPAPSFVLRAKVAAFLELDAERRRGEVLRAELAAQRAYNRSIIEGTSDAIFLVGPDGRIIDANERAVAVTGSTREEVVGSIFSVHFSEQAAARKAVRRAFEAGSSRGTRLVPASAAATATRLSCDATRFGDTSTGDGAVVASLRDVTEQCLLEEQLRETNQALERSSFNKDRFLRTISHELRTPLNSVIGFAGVLGMGLDGPLSEDQTNHVRAIQSSSKQLLALINQVLDLAKIEAGRVEVTLQAVDCGAVVAEVAQRLASLAGEKGLALAVTPLAAPVNARADRPAFEQILTNLIGNAIKFTGEGEIRISCGPAPGRPDFVEVAVTDTGPGIADEDRERVFDSFVRLGDGKEEGSGLGLQICRSLAAAMGAELSCTSVVGHGSTFTLSMPRA